MNAIKIVILTVIIFIIIGLIIYLTKSTNSSSMSSTTNTTTSAPSSGSKTTTSAPSKTTTSAPSSGSKTTTSAPSKTTTSAPSSGSTTTTSAPSSGSTTTTSAPSSGSTTTTSAPSSGSTTTTSAPSSSAYPTVSNPGDVIKIAYGDANKPVFVAPDGHTNNIGTLPFTVGAGSKLFNFKYTPMPNFPAGVNVRSRITFYGPKSYEIYKEFSSPINILTISHVADNSELPPGTYSLNIYIDYGESFSVEGTVAIAAPAAKRNIFNIYDNTGLFKDAMLNEAMKTTINVPVISNTDKVSLLFDGTVSISCQGAANPFSIKFTLYNENKVYNKSFEKLSANWGDTDNHNILPFTVIFTDVKPGAYKFVIGSGSSWPSSCTTDINDYVSAFYEIIIPSSSSLVSRSIYNLYDNQTLNVGSIFNTNGIMAYNISVPVIAKLIFNGYITIACTNTAAYTIEFRLKNDTYSSITSRSYANYSRNKHVISPFTAVFYDVPPGTYNLVIGSSKDWPVSICNTSPNDYLSIFCEVIPTPVSTSPLLLRTRNIETIWDNAGLPDGSAITRVDGISTSIINIPSSISSASIIINGCISIRCSMDGIAYTIKFRLQKTGGGYDKSFKRTYADWIGKGHNISPFMIMFPEAPPGNYKFNISADDESVAASKWKGCNTDNADFLTAFYEIVPN